MSSRVSWKNATMYTYTVHTDRQRDRHTESMSSRVSWENATMYTYT